MTERRVGRVAKSTPAMPAWPHKFVEAPLAKPSTCAALPRPLTDPRLDRYLSSPMPGLHERAMVSTTFTTAHMERQQPSPPRTQAADGTCKCRTPTASKSVRPSSLSGGGRRDGADHIVPTGCCHYRARLTLLVQRTQQRISPAKWLWIVTR
jgi:hypothetical protein